eukprot:UN28602
MKRSSSWDPLTSPPHDMEIAREVFGRFGFQHYAFINLTGSQMTEVSKLIAATLLNDPNIVLLFHFSGHGGILKKKMYLKQCLIGTDGTRNGHGCFSVLKFLNRTGLMDAFCILICDCCREFIEGEDEAKG